MSNPAPLHRVLVQLALFTIIDGRLSYRLAHDPSRDRDYWSRLEPHIINGQTIMVGWTLPSEILDTGKDVADTARSLFAYEVGRHDGIILQTHTVSLGDDVVVGFVACIRPDLDTHEIRQMTGKWALSNEWQKSSIGAEALSILKAGRESIRATAKRLPIAAMMMPQEFSLTEMQTATEAIIGRNLDKRNFRLKVLKSGWLVETGGVLRGQHRPAKLYRISDRWQARLARASSRELAVARV